MQFWSVLGPKNPHQLGYYKQPFLTTWGAPAGTALSTNFKIQNVRALASQVVLDSALVESFNRAPTTTRCATSTLARGLPAPLHCRLSHQACPRCR